MSISLHLGAFRSPSKNVELPSFWICVSPVFTFPSIVTSDVGSDSASFSAVHRRYVRVGPKPERDGSYGRRTETGLGRTHLNLANSFYFFLFYSLSIFPFQLGVPFCFVAKGFVCRQKKWQREGYGEGEKKRRDRWKGRAQGGENFSLTHSCFIKLIFPLRINNFHSFSPPFPFPVYHLRSATGTAAAYGA